MSDTDQPRPAKPGDIFAAPLLAVESLQVQFQTPTGVLRAVDGLSFDIGANETVAIVGESGCGKSATSLAIMRLISGSNGRVAGAIRLNGVDLLPLSEDEMRSIRGNDISMIFQEPMTSLNPVLKIGWQIAENIRLHQPVGRREAERKAVEMIDLVGIPDPKRRSNEYPHQLSGGMRQRVMIAMALACNPKLLIADEPTTALDVTIQAQILQLMRNLKERIGTSIMLITHDLGVVGQIADRVIVMYAGRKVEEGPMRRVLSNPLHPYTSGLLAAIPRIETGERQDRPLAEIPGSLPDLREKIDGCTFAPRCPHASGICRESIPILAEYAAGHFAACLKVTALSEGSQPQ